MPKISAVGLFCCDKFEETPIKKVCNISKLSKSYFRASRALKKEWINGIYLYIDLGNPTVKFYTKREKANKTGFLLMYLKLK